MDLESLIKIVASAKVVADIINGPPAVPNQWIPVLAAIGGAFVGGLAPLITSLCTERSKRKHERIAAGNALAAEVSALMSIIKARNYIERLSEIAEAMQEQPSVKRRVIIQVPSHYSRVYQSYVSRLGSLHPKFAANLIQFHQLIDAIVQDFQPGGLAEIGQATPAMLAENAGLLRAAVAAGEKILLQAGLSEEVKPASLSDDSDGGSSEDTQRPSSPASTSS